MNRATLIGRLGADPKYGTTRQGGEVANFSVATSEKYKNDQGEIIENTDWHNVAVFGNLVSVVKKFLKKGTKVFVEGKLKQKKYTDERGIDRSVHEVVLSNYKSELKVLTFDNQEDRSNGNRQNSYTTKNSYKNAKDGDYEF